MLCHDVYFTLEDSSSEACQALVDACHQLLGPIDGILFFGAGPREEALARDVNDDAFHVSLKVVFSDRKAHDAYQTAAAHLLFIAENQDNWRQVRVFDSLVTGGAR